MKSVNMEFADSSKNYPIHVGHRLYEDPDLLSVVDGKHVICIIDKNAPTHVYQKYIDNMSKIASSIKTIISPFDRDKNKTYQALEFFCEAVAEHLPTRTKTAYVVIGGGAIGDIGNFVSSIYLRGGCDVIMLPTTLLSMVDSSVGGKTAINSKNVKNAIGTFRQPKLVICDVDFLSTLNYKEIMCGYAELLKHTLILNADAFNQLQKNTSVWKKIQDNHDFVIDQIALSVDIKKHFVCEDEFDLTGHRATVNFGHTVGHALEKLDESHCLHGEAVAMGMYVESDVSKEMGVLSAQDTYTIKEHLKEVSLWQPELIPAGQINRLMTLMSGDKKSEPEQIVQLDGTNYCYARFSMVIPEKIGKATLNKGVDHKTIIKCLEKVHQ